MELEYFLTQEDFLTYQLFAASESTRLKKRRRFSWLLLPCVYCAFSLFFYSRNFAFAFFFLILALLWLGVFPFYSRWFYKKQYLKGLTAKYGKKLQKTSLLKIENDALQIRDELQETILPIQDIVKIIVLPRQVLLWLKTGAAVILPKARIAPQELQAFLDKISQLTALQLTTRLDWKWK